MSGFIVALSWRIAMGFYQIASATYALVKSLVDIALD
tara:strand:+ start:609 stop:719 length:111 start_codon:yes stop_codon:yes gene_type:complete